MAKTIEQIQARIDSQSLDARQLINLIADYLQANPGGGGVTLYTGDGALAGDRIVDLGEFSLIFQDDGRNLFRISPPGAVTSLSAYIDADNYTEMTLYGGGGGSVRWEARNYVGAVLSTEIIIDGSNQAIDILGVVNGTRIYLDDFSENIAYTADTHTFNGAIINPDLVAADFADDTAAGVGGIAVGGLYHTAGVVKVRLA